jgi:hypothetical protein
MPVRSVLVAGAVVVGARNSDEVRAGLALAETAGCRILGIGFDGSGRVTGVTSVPALLGPGHVEAAAAALREVAS